MRKVLKVNFKEKYFKKVRAIDCSKGKIYAIATNGDFYKLHYVGDSKYAFISLMGSRCWANGKGGFQEMLEHSNFEEDIYEFDDLKEFIDWIQKEIKI